MAGKFDFVAAPGQPTLVMTQTFDTDRATLFEAWTRPEQVALWWDPTGAKLAVCEIDLRPGGSFRWVHQGEMGHAFGGTYTEIAPPDRLAFKSVGTPGGPERLSTLTFAENNGKTTLTINIVCASVAQRDALLEMRVQIGTARTLQNLTQFLEEKSP